MIAGLYHCFSLRRTKVNAKYFSTTEHQHKTFCSNRVYSVYNTDVIPTHPSREPRLQSKRSLSYRGCVYKSPESCLLCAENAMFVGWMIVVPVSQPRCNSFFHPGQGCCGVCCSGSVAASNSRAELQTSQSEFIAGGGMCACAIVVRRRCFSYRLVSRCPVSVVINVPTSY
jgi:hypothetical protein